MKQQLPLAALQGFMALFVTLHLFSCIRKDFDSPPDSSGYDPKLPVTHSIQALQEMPQGVAIMEQVIVSGIVVMDDKSGNYYKKIVIQDETGGIEVLIDQSNLYNDYPVGRKVYVRCKDLFLGLNGENLQLGYTPNATGSLSNIPAVLVGQFLVKANYPNTLAPDTFSLSQLASPEDMKQHLNTLVAIKEAEFADEHTGIPYAQLAGISSATYLTLQDCSGGTMVMRNSGYAKFQPYLTPAGNGFVLGIYTRYNNSPQLCIRDTSDVMFYNARCDNTSPGTAALVSIDSLRRLFSGSDLTLGAYKIRGIVISDRDNGNVANGSVIFQGGNDDKGIILYYGGSPEYALGDSLEIDVTGNKLKLFNGKLEIEGVKTNRTLKLAADRSITPKTLTIAELIANLAVYESSLIRIQNASFQQGAATYNGTSGNLTISDGSGTITHYCSLQATFKDNPLPESPVTAVTGYIDIFNGTAQLRMRQPGPPVNDVVP